MTTHFHLGYTSGGHIQSAIAKISTKNDLILCEICYLHGRILKRTQHIGFLTLARVERVVEGNHGNDLKEG